MNDAQQILGSKSSTHEHDSADCHEAIYAEDTLLIDTCQERLQQYLQAVVSEGKTYGLNINWDKVECMPINCDCSLKEY